MNNHPRRHAFQIAFVNIGGSFERVGCREIDQIAALPDFGPFRKRFCFIPTSTGAGGINDLPGTRSVDFGLCDLIFDFIEFLFLPIEFALLGAKGAFRLNDGGMGFSSSSFQSGFFLANIAIQLGQFAFMRIVFKQSERAATVFERQFVVLPGQFIAFEFAFGEKTLFIELLRPVVLFLGLLKLLFGKGKISLGFAELIRIFAFGVLNQVFLGKFEGLLCQFDVGSSLIASDFEVFCFQDETGLCVFNFDLLIHQLILLFGGIELDKQIAFFDNGAFRNDVEKGDAPFHLALYRNLFARIDFSIFTDGDYERTAAGNLIKLLNEVTVFLSLQGENEDRNQKKRDAETNPSVYAFFL